MSILIKGMEMPKSCPECPIADRMMFCGLTRKTYNWGLIERPSDCPLIPVVDTTPRCPHCGGKTEKRGGELYCYSCHFWWEVKE